MKTFLSSIIPKLQSYSDQLNNKTKLVDHRWILMGDTESDKRVYIFRGNNDLLVFENGTRVEKGTWEFIGADCLSIETQESARLFKHAFKDDQVMILRLDHTDRFVFFINESKFPAEVQSIHDLQSFLAKTYLIGAAKTDSGPAAVKNEMSYKENAPVPDWNPVRGKFQIIQILFEGGRSANIYKGESSGRFYFITTHQGMVYYDKKEDCIAALHRYLSER